MVTSQLCARGYCGVDLKCRLTETCVDSEDQIRYTTYGMIAEDAHGTVYFEHTDISTRREDVLRLISMCESGQVAAVHIPDLVEDFLMQ